MKLYRVQFLEFYGDKTAKVHKGHFSHLQKLVKSFNYQFLVKFSFKVFRVDEKKKILGKWKNNG